MQSKLRLTAYYVSLFCLTSSLIGCDSGSESTTKEETLIGGEPIEVTRLADWADGYVVGAALPAGDASNSVIYRDDLQSVVRQHFSQISAENIMKPEFLQPAEGQFSYEFADDLVDFAEQNGISVHGHTLIWHKRIADFMENCSGEAECSGYLIDHITDVVGRYKGRIASWDVVNEAFTDDWGYQESTYRDIDSYESNGVYGSVWYREIGKQYIPMAFTAAHAADPDAELYYNDYNLEDNNSKLTAVVTMANELIDADVPIDGIGFQMHISLEAPSIEDIKEALTTAVATGLKIKITELDIRTNVDGEYDTYTSEVEALLSARYQAVAATYLEVVPAEQVGGITMWGVSDADSWIPDTYGYPDWPLLFDEQLTPKEALNGLASAMRDAAE